MHTTLAAPSIVVGIDGSPAARDAAVWAVDEAVSRDIPLRLVCVIDPADRQLATARRALSDAQRAVESTGEPVKIETEVAHGAALTELRRLSRSAALVCVGSLGAEHARHGAGSVATTLASAAHCPVAVVQHSPSPLSGEVGSIVADARSAEPDAVLEHAFEEARLREAPLAVVTACRAEVRDGNGDRSCPVHAQLARRLASWVRRYPDVQVHTVAAPGTVPAYLAAHTESIQLVVSAAASFPRPGHSVLTVRTRHL